MEIIARNTNDLQSKVYAALQEHGVSDTSRNGNVLRFSEPVTTILTNPLEKVNFCPVRDANPFFHLVEAMAMLAGHNSVKLMSYFAKNMLSFSDDGVSYNAFYGTRMRKTWGDQLEKVIETLRDVPDSRQVVVNLWEPNDLWANTVDKACNLQIIFSIVDDKVRMTTTNRSNDAIWGGVNGANVVHFAFFMEYVCCALNLEPEKWFHFSNNLHVYLDNPKWEKLKDSEVDDNDPGTQIRLFSLEGGMDENNFDETVEILCDELEIMCQEDGAYINADDYENEFLREVVVPMANTFHAWKQGKDVEEIQSFIDEWSTNEWTQAGWDWLDRRNFTKK